MSAILFEVIVPFEIEKKIKRFPKKIQERIKVVIEGLRTEPRPYNCRPIEGYDFRYRMRISDYRVVYDIDDGKITVLVVSVGPRKRVYDDMS